MFDKFFEFIGWKKKKAPSEEWVSFAPPTEEVPPPLPESPKEEVKPFTMPDPALLYKTDETYVPYRSAVDEDLKELFNKNLEDRRPEPLPDPPPSIDSTIPGFSKPQVITEEEVVPDPYVNAVVEELSKEEKKKKVKAPRRKDPMVAATAKELSKVKKKKPAVKDEFAELLKKKTVAKKAVKKSKNKPKK